MSRVQYAESLCVKYCTYIKVYGCHTDGLIQEVIFLTVHVYILYPPPPTHTHPQIYSSALDVTDTSGTK